MPDLYLAKQTFQIIGICMEVHKILGKGHNEIVDGDASEYEFTRNKIPFEREKNIILLIKTLFYLIIISPILLFLMR